MRVFSYYVVLLILFALVLGLIFINMFDKSNTEHRGAELERVGTNASNAIRKFDRNVSIHGISSRKTTFLPAGNPERKLPNSKKASCQSSSRGQSQCPC